MRSFPQSCNCLKQLQKQAQNTQSRVQILLDVSLFSSCGGYSWICVRSFTQCTVISIGHENENCFHAVNSVHGCFLEFIYLSHWSGKFSPFYGRVAKSFPVSLLYNHGFKSGLELPTQIRRNKSAEDLKMKAHRTSLLMEHQWSEPTFRDPPPGGARNYFVFRPLPTGVKRSVMVPVGQVSCGLASRRKRGR